MKVAVSQDMCIASGHCTVHAPGVFDQGDDDGLVLLLDASPAAEHSDAVRTAARFCPAQAIQIEE
ncbi:ferredoxin [Nocardia sp. 2]|uniref:Ferredoxin n=2 Tax=Nocardia acididurans TaxID=2802282 RepID=A0ABS1MFI3_9NOCA|nr:ferredoxin [Nocardia acididurans]MBL1079382.1 ferredoxin [Nocardia acididurans]